MFLNRLGSEEKKAFISLAVKAAEANGIIADEENQMIDEYCKEIRFTSFNRNDEMLMSDIINTFSKSDEQNKKIVLLELIGLMYADGGFDEHERVFVNDFAKEINVSDVTEKKIEQVLIEYLEVTKKILDVIS